MLCRQLPRVLGVTSVAVLLAACGAAPNDEGESASAAAISTSDPAYAEGQLHSTLTPEIVTSLKSVLAASSGDTHHFVKVGDSITVSTSFLDCLATKSVTGDLEPTRLHFDSSETSWSRRTKSAVVGWHTTQPISGSPSPLDSEIADMNPAFAVVMLGTNNNNPSQVSGCSGAGGTCAYRKNLEQVVDALLGKNIIPLLSTIPPRGNSATADARVPAMNAIVRFVAAERKIPLMDFHLAIEGLPGKGLGPDGIHPNAASTGACDFSASGLNHGYNVRNHLVLEALDHVRRALLGTANDTTDAAPAAAESGNPTDAGPTTPTATDAPTAGAIPTETLQSVDNYSVIASALHCRSAAGTAASIVETLANGAIVAAMPDATDTPRILTDDTGAPWLHVTTPSGTTCYVSADASLISPI